MKLHRFNSRFTYRVDYMLRNGRKSRCAFLTDEIPVAIREVDPLDAPVAYTIASLEYGLGDAIQVRSFDGSLWWPITWKWGPLKASELLTLTERYWDAASTVLDPMRRTYFLNAPPGQEFFGNMLVRKDKFVSTRSDQSKSAEWDAHRLIFCEGNVLVDAGEPVWYAVHDATTRTFDVFIGHSNLDRPNIDGYFTPGPDRSLRLTCARLARAYGLDEFETMARSMGGESVIRRRSEIVATSVRPTATAADLCVRALAQYLWEIAWRYPDLRKAMPSVAKASNRKPPPEALPHRQMLEQLVSFEDPTLTRSLSFLMTDAQRILERLALSECPPLTDEENTALGDLAIEFA